MTAYRELDGHGRYIVRTHHKHTAGGQRIEGQLLQHECKGASDYCMHCSTEQQAASPRWCLALNELAYGKDREAEEARQRKYDERIAEIMAPMIAAFGCDKESKGGAACPRWCGSEDCAYVVHDSTRGVPDTQAGLPGTTPKSVNTTHGAQGRDQND